MIDINKKYTTRDGHEVRIYATDAGGDYPVHGAIKQDGEWRSEDWAANGNFLAGVKVPGVHGDSPGDLVEVKTKREGWVNICSTGANNRGFVSFVSHAYPTQADADENADDDRVACIRIEWLE